MFENTLKKNFENIFKIKKVTFDDPGTEQEQDCIFITVDNANPTIRDSEEIYRVVGSAIIYAPNKQLPFGFISKAIKQADKSMTKDLFFSNIESNIKTYRDKVGRSFDFVFFFRGQYDPNQGTITSVDLTIEET